MRTYFPLAAFLIAPFLLPEVASYMKMAGMLLLWACAVLSILSHHESDSSSHFIEMSLLLSGLLCFGLGLIFPDAVFYSYFPGMISGLFILCILQNAAFPAWMGIGCIAVSGWVLLILHRVFPALVPADFFYQEWDVILSAVDPSIVSPLIGMENPNALLPIQWLTYLSTFLLVFSAYFQDEVQHNLFYSIWIGVLLVLCSGFFIYIFGVHAFVMMSLSLLLYLCVYLVPFGHVQWKNAWQWALLFGFLCVGAMGYLDFIIIQISQLVFLLPIQLPAPILLAESRGTGSSTLAWSSSDWIALFVIALFVIALVLINGILRWKWIVHQFENNAAYLSCMAGILFFLDLTPLMLIAHPVFWLCLGAILFSVFYETDTQDIHISWLERVPVSVIRYGCLAIFGVLGVWGLYSLNTERIAEHQIQNLYTHHSAPHLLAIADEARKVSFHRADIRAVYLTLFVQDAVARSTFLSEGELVELEVANQMCSRNGVIPYLAVKRTSDFYFLIGDTARTTASLSELLDKHPGDIKLHEMLAERLFDFGRYKEALEHYEVCVNDSPTAVRYHQKIAMAYKSLGDDEAYKRSAAIVQTLNPSAVIP